MNLLLNSNIFELILDFPNMEPIQFISTGESGNELTINEAALKILDEEKRPVTVVCVVGPYRTGIC
jgi:hypothetical protein